MENVEIARALNRVGDLLEIRGANAFRVRAYRMAARVVEDYPEPIERLVAAEADLTELPSIGPDTARYIRELAIEGRLARLEELEREVPVGLIEVMRLEGLGPKRANALWQGLGVTSLADLEVAAREGRIATLRGFSARTQQQLLERLAARGPGEARRLLLPEADQYARSLRERMAAASGVERIEVAGSWRRRRETIGDLDVLVTSEGDAAPIIAPIIARLTGWDAVARVLGAGETRASVVLRAGVQVDLRVVAPDQFGAALMYFTGSQAHNIRLRGRALDRGLRLSEYGLFEQPSDEEAEPRRIAAATEEEVYAALGLAWVPPERREDWGELAAAERGEVPALIEAGDLRGDLHVHTTWSPDGRADLEEMLAACEARGYRYVAITDHSRSNGGLTPEAVPGYLEDVEAAAARHPRLRVLRGAEVDVLRDGTLDLPDEVLATLDWVVASVHSHFTLGRREQTARVLRALAHPTVSVLGHPSGRQLNRREPIDLDLDEVLHAAADLGVAMELNGHPARLDLRDVHLLRAKELGVKVVISSDAHSPRGLEAIRYGVDQARRAGFAEDDVLNTLAPARFLRAMRRSR